MPVSRRSLHLLVACGGIRQALGVAQPYSTISNSGILGHYQIFSYVRRILMVALIDSGPMNSETPNKVIGRVVELILPYSCRGK
jgi:hypothetical protein